MTITLIFLAVLLAVFCGWLLSHTFGARPWATSGAVLDGSDRMPTIFTGPRLGLAVFLAAITSLFALTISAYGMRMHMGGDHMGGDWVSVPVPGLLWVNTLILVLGSIALQSAWRAAVRDRAGALRRGLAAGGVCTMAFVVGQYVAWQQLHAAGYSLAANPANSFFYFVTALHVLHVIGGLVAWGRTAARVWRGAEPRAVRSSIELCALYWHYLLIIWAVLFGLLLAT
jgi:cytochrome c oxidase subunit III